jgi:hypothetical protein
MGRIFTEKGNLLKCSLRVTQDGGLATILSCSTTLFCTQFWEYKDNSESSALEEFVLN